MQIIHKLTMLSQAKRTKAWKGYAAPHKVNFAHINTGWCLGVSITVWVQDGVAHVDSGYEGNPYIETLDAFVERFSRNQPNELGNRVRFWQVKGGAPDANLPLQDMQQVDNGHTQLSSH